MKKIISKKLIIMLFVFVIIISGSNVFAKTTNNDWSGFEVISFIIIFILVGRIGLKTILKSLIPKKMNNFKNSINNINNIDNNIFSNNITNIVNNENSIFGDNPEITSKEVANMIKNEDASFVEEDFFKYACEAFIEFRKKIPTDKFKNLDEYESELLNEHFEKFNKKISNTNETVQKAYLLDYKIENNNEILIVGIELDCNTQYRLSFSREYTQQNKEDLTITCPYCGAPNQNILLGICKYCRGRLVKERGKWILNKVTGLNSVRIEKNINENFNSFF